MPLALIAAPLLGALSALGFAPLDLWPFTLLATAGLVHLIGQAPSGGRSALLGWLFGLGQFTLGLNWIATAFTYQAAMPAWLGWVAVVLLSLYLAIYPALATLIAWRLGRRHPVRLALWFAIGWIATEWLRGWIFTGFPWNPLGVAWLPVPLVPQAAALVGTLGLSGLLALAAAGLSLISTRHWRSGMAMVATAPLLAGMAWLVVRDPGVATRGDIDPRRIIVVQPNIGQNEKWQPGYEARNFERLARLSGRPGSAPRLILWPEAAVPDYLEEEPAARQRLARLLGPDDLLMTGGVGLVRDPRTSEVVAARNSLFLIDARGRLLDRYDKAHLVPYGEYLPMRPILSAIGLSRLAPGDLDFLPGPGPRTLDLPGFGSAGIQICYEMVFTGHVVDPAHRPLFLFNPSNDAWFGAWGPPQHLAQARLRAIEEGLPVIRSTPTGISAVIDTRGRLLANLGAHRADALVTPPFQSVAAIITPFAHWGNFLPLTFALVLLAIAIALGRKAR